MKRNSFQDILEISKKRKVKVLTSYTANIARFTQEIADILLVGDSLGMVLYGFPSTHGVTIEMMELHTKAVANATQKPIILSDMPFGTFEHCEKIAFQNASKLIISGANAVKIEGGIEIAPVIKFLIERGIPVVGHVGLMPQKIHTIGSYAKITQTDCILKNFEAVYNAGATAIVLENIADEISIQIAKEFPNAITIGIGAGSHCKGHVAVFEDLINLSTAKTPPFSTPIFNTKLTVKPLIEKFFDDI